MSAMCRGKIRHSSREAAENAISRAWRTGRGKKLPIRAYKCPICGCYHTTSKPDRKTS